MRQVRGLVSVMTIALLLAGPAIVRAQDDEPRISQPVISATTVLNDEQQQQIKTYVAYWADLFESGNEQEVPVGRTRLIEPFNSAGATDIFITAYSAAVAMKLKPLIDHSNPLVRVNGMLVLRYVSDRGVVDLLRTGLADDNPGVRYLAAQAAGAVGANRRVAGEQRQRVFDTIQTSLASEPDQRVVEQLLLAMLGVANDTDARKTLIGHINRRLDVHASFPQLSVKAVYEVQAKLYRRLISAGGQLDREAVRTMLPVAARSLLLATTVLDRQLGEPSVNTQYKNVITITDTILRWGVGELAPELASKAPAKLDESVQRRDWKAVMVRAEEWKHLLTQAPLNYSADQIQINVP
jgi:hypothetical protein